MGTIAERSLTIFSVYMPNDDNTVDNSTDFVGSLGEIDATVENNDIQDIFMLGDFNAHPQKQLIEITAIL